MDHRFFQAQIRKLTPPRLVKPCQHPYVAAMTGQRTNLIGLSRDELAAAIAAAGEKPFRARQLWHWVYHQGVTDFADMTTLAKGTRAKFAEMFSLARPQISVEQLSEDRTRKWLMRFDDGNEAECVFIPEEDRGALCISSQVGCTLSCSFCHTGTQALVRNLKASEIVAQMLVARDAYGEWPSDKETTLLSNIVFMGMGEPLLNYDEVSKALAIIIDGDGIAISRRRITLSTAGVVPMIRRLGAEVGVNLAISLHAPTDALRNELIPLNRKYPLKELMAALRDYPGARNSRRITLEYIMLKGVNDSTAQAHELIRLVKDIPVKFNLIPFNPWPGSNLKTSSISTCQRFSKILNDAGYSAPIRKPRGRDIMAACGQLKSASEKLRASQRPTEAATAP